ncbi:hypothetical protein CEXT_44101 [Caerostris extrusa]|uniref:HAT C-terminal dimerisation domain-containing protein n=1 Tax=Caerostris extrusa TaxID=172846 RepID=A0AAV4WA99_CAEEX|nr:hypothetical protein CEXT_44101 [Caerostris extrusa]
MFKEGELKEEIIDVIHSQLCELQVENLPSNSTDESRVDTQWSLIEKNYQLSCSKKISEIVAFVLSLLIILHSNAKCERIFSLMTKNKAHYRTSLSNKSLKNLKLIKVPSIKRALNKILAKSSYKEQNHLLIYL